jgi:hypothetical protein
MENQNINDVSSEDIGLTIINLFGQRSQIEAEISRLGNFLIERKNKQTIVPPKENSDAASQ